MQPDQNPVPVPNSSINSNDKPAESPQVTAPTPQPTITNVPGTPLQPTTSSADQPLTPGQIILQWLTYAFWGWTVLALATLISSVLTSLIGSKEVSQYSSGFSPYAIAAVLVLLPISLICDFFFAKHEPKKKTGTSMLVMVIHAVIFALLGIAAVITCVFSIVQLATTSGDSTSTRIMLYSAGLIASVYAATFVRTLNPPNIPGVRKVFIGFMVIMVGTFVVLGFIGPVAQANLTKNDVLIDDNLMTISQQIESYSGSNKQLPGSLDSLKLTGDAATVVQKRLVTYEANTKTSQTLGGTTTYYYQLCATYKKESPSPASQYSSSDATSTDGYSTYLNTNGHAAGKVCYKIKHEVYGPIPNQSILDSKPQEPQSSSN